jgi:hypothetical protein
MRAVKKASCFVLLILGLLISIAPALATSVIEQTFPDLVHRADGIAIGTVTGIQEQWDVARQAPLTHVTFSNLTVLKGSPGAESMTLEFLGGHAPDGTVLTIPGVPRFTVGEKNVVFSAGNHRDFCPLVGVWQGLLRVKADPQRGVETVSNHAYIPIIGMQDGKFLQRASEAPAQEALPLSTLIQLIQQELRSPYGRQ